jgi:hypothetical protein
MMEALRRLVACKIGLVHEALDRLATHSIGLAIAAHLKPRDGDRINAVHHNARRLRWERERLGIGEQLGKFVTQIRNPLASRATDCGASNTLEPKSAESCA